MFSVTAEFNARFPLTTRIYLLTYLLYRIDGDRFQWFCCSYIAKLQSTISRSNGSGWSFRRYWSVHCMFVGFAGTWRTNRAMETQSNGQHPGTTQQDAGLERRLDTAAHSLLIHEQYTEWTLVQTKRLSCRLENRASALCFRFIVMLLMGDWLLRFSCLVPVLHRF